MFLILHSIVPYHLSSIAKMHVSKVFFLIYQLIYIAWIQAALPRLNISTHSSILETPKGDLIDPMIQQLSASKHAEIAKSIPEAENNSNEKSSKTSILQDTILNFLNRKKDHILIELSTECQAIIASFVKLWEAAPVDQRGYISAMITNYTSLPLKVGVDIGIIYNAFAEDKKLLDFLSFFISLAFILGAIGLITLVAELFSNFSFLTKWFRRGMIWTAVFVMVLSFVLNLIATLL